MSDEELRRLEFDRDRRAKHARCRAQGHTWLEVALSVTDQGLFWPLWSWWAMRGDDPIPDGAVLSRQRSHMCEVCHEVKQRWGPWRALRNWSQGRFMLLTTPPKPRSGPYWWAPEAE